MDEWIFRIDSLPKGMASVYGHFIRSTWLLSYQKPCIIGFNLNELGVFDLIGETTPVSDIVALIASSKYTVKLRETTNVKTYQFPTYTVYDVLITKTNTAKFTTSDLNSFVHFEEEFTLCESVSTPMDIEMHLYIKTCSETAPAQVNQAFLAPLNELTGLKNIIPIASNNIPFDIGVLPTIEEAGTKENLVVTVKGSMKSRMNFISCVKDSLDTIANELKKSDALSNFEDEES